MINSLALLRNVGAFSSVNPGPQIAFRRLTLGYADNGKGKSTLASLLRSLGDGNPDHIASRHRLGAQHPPHLVVDCSGGPPAAMFQNGAWSRQLPDIVVFDEAFVSENLCDGPTLDAEHRQSLHEFILGARGVALGRALKAKVERIEVHNSDLRRLAGAIPAHEMGGMSADEFCALQALDGVDLAIVEAERELAAAREQEPIRRQGTFEPLSTPSIDVGEIGSLLDRHIPDLEAQAAAQVATHLSSIGPEAAEWVASGHHRRGPGHNGNDCPYCAQDLSASPIIGFYQAYFSDAYMQLKGDVEGFRRSFSEWSHWEGDFERAYRSTLAKREFWARFWEVPALSLDTAAICARWREACGHVAGALASKSSAPLERISLTEDARAAIATFAGMKAEVDGASAALVAANAAIERVKARAAGNVPALEAALRRLKATKSRHSAPTSQRCAEYLAEAAAKAQTERERASAREALDAYRTTVFPQYEAAVNAYLTRFGASFTMSRVSPTNTRGGASVSYSVVINNVDLPVSGVAHNAPSFRTALSTGDRTTLALAFFFASLDLDPSKASRIVVIDDPVTSLDDGRSIATVQRIRGLAAEVSQVVVLSHRKEFLCRVWEYADQAATSAFQVVRGANGSDIRGWDVALDSATEHDRRCESLRAYLAGRALASRELARGLRPTLEAFLRVAYPEHFPPGKLLGPFRDACDRKVGTADEILRAPDIAELRALTEYANRFHHDSNPAWETESVTDAELQSFARRVFAFTKRP